MASVSSQLGSSTMMGWKRRSRAVSFSMYLRCSSSVVAPMHCSSPRASAGFSRLEMSRPPPPPPPRPTAPAPTSVCTSSTMRMMSPSSRHSAISLVTRFSSSPRSLAPATMRPTSSDRIRLRSRKSGTAAPSSWVPRTMAHARPSAMAVLPTPASPSRMGLFLVRRARICAMRWICFSRPKIGSVLPCLYSSLRSRQYSSVILDSPFFFLAAPARVFL
mmetsp:Transcript_2299/g.5769  ORF Transcript_2299/g.5769 Transcript_2299/m.5769 type:complete len:218 (-) Transcript_2299:920-1573(-)